MRLLKVGAASLNQTPLDWTGNLDRIRQVVLDAKQQEVQLLCLPELCITGYGCEDQFHSRGLQEKALKQLLVEVAPMTEGITICVGLPILYRNALYNCAALVQNGKVLGLVAKQHLAGDGLHYEPRWFRPWPTGVVGSFPFWGEELPIGDLTFQLQDAVVGFEICEDAWVADRPGASLARRGVDIILNPSASHFAFGKSEVRKRFVIEGSRSFGVTYVYANLLGNEAGRVIYEGDCLIASGGQLVAQGPRFSYQDWNLTTAIVDLDSTKTAQLRTTSFHPGLTQGATVQGQRLENPPFDPLPPVSTPPEVETWEAHGFVKEKEFTRAVSLGLYDYMRKSRSQGFVISLSGGADSAACAVLVSTMVHLATQELGYQKCCQRLFNQTDTVPEQPLISKILTCVYQGTENSSEQTLKAARAVADGVGAAFHNINVGPLVEAYTALASSMIGREVTWKQDDIPMQNIQARVRAPSIWFVANLKNALLLSTSNRSEAAVGYCTMDGDTAGAISPIAGIDKTFLREWLLWMQYDVADGLEHIPALSKVNHLEPTAELRPAGAAQTDEKDLMPYSVLNLIEKAAIRDKKTPLEVLTTLERTLPSYTLYDLGLWVTRFFRLWSRNQWKRERFALSFHVDDENLDPRSWCRFPVLSGGFEDELESVAAHVGARTAC